MSRFSCVNLSQSFNAPARLASGRKGISWNPAVENVRKHIPRGRASFWGIPFRLGPADLAKKGLILLHERKGSVRVPVRRRTNYLCFLHFSDLPKNPEANTAGGELLAEYTLEYEDGTTCAQPIRRRFEVFQFAMGWGQLPFLAVPNRMPSVLGDDPTRYGWGPVQTGTTGPYGPFYAWVYALENPHPEKAVAAVSLDGRDDLPVAVLGLTLYAGPGHPLRHLPRRMYKLILPAQEKAVAGDVEVKIDMGNVTRVFAVPHRVDGKWLKDPSRGLGLGPRRPEPGREFLVEATGAEGAVLSVKSGRKSREIPFGPAFREGKSESANGKARVELVHHGSQWLHVTVTDESAGKPAPVRVQFLGPHGEYLPPYGHHAVVNDRWFEDYGGDLKLGDSSYAYVPGNFHIELPTGTCFVELWKGFEYEPVRKKLEILPGQRTLDLSIGRTADLRKEGWVTADTHVHFISPETAWLEGQGEGLNLINLLASQWGRLFTNVADISGDASGCSRDDTIIWVGTENRNHMLGHISMLGTHGDPVFPMCAGGADEAYLGDPDVTTLTEWAMTCKERDGVVIRPHFPSPVCEEPVYFMLEQLDGAELRGFANPDSGSLDVHCFREWYRYLNCGCRVAAVGGTDKMSAGMPVGGVRTYARLDPDDEFTFENWGKAVRAGRTFTTSGPLIDLIVDGHEVGDEIRMPEGGGTVEVHASADSIWPISRLEIVVNGRLAARTARKNGASRLEIRQKVQIDGSGWIAARCGSRLLVHHCWPIHLGAHTSPVYVVCGDRSVFSPADAAYMLTLIDGGLAYLSTLSVRYEDGRHREMKGIYERARAEILRREGLARG